MEDNLQKVEKENKIKAKIHYYAKRYFITAMSGMAFGLFASLIIGTIIAQLARIPILDFLNEIVVYITFPGATTGTATGVTTGATIGAAIGAGVALSLKHKNMVILASVSVGVIGYQLGGMLGAYIAAVVGSELGSLVAGKTKVDIVLTPLVVILTGGIMAYLIGPFFNDGAILLGEQINKATDLNPFLMGIILAVCVGMILTAPISSAALCMTLGLDGIAAGAACVGCCVQMVGFAVCSYKKNGWGGLLSIGLGTSMLQFHNVVRKPIIWLPTIITSAILGPISACVLKMENNSSGAGMGTSGLVGQINAFSVMSDNNVKIFTQIWQVMLMHFIAPVILVLLINYLLIKLKLLKHEDYQLDNSTN